MELAAIIAFARAAIQDGPEIMKVLQTGTAVFDAAKPVIPVLEQKAPALVDAIRQLASKVFTTHGGPEDHPGSVSEAIAKAIVAPHAITPAEQNWMDRASFSTGQ